MHMNLKTGMLQMLARRFARFASTLGWLDGVRGFPGEEDFIEVPVYGENWSMEVPAHRQSAAVLKIQAADALNRSQAKE